VTQSPALTIAWNNAPITHFELSPISASGSCLKAAIDLARAHALLKSAPFEHNANRHLVTLRADIWSFIEHHNAHPRPFRWTKSADDILSSIERFCAYNLPAT
jgi:hypothetical protein